MVPKNVLPNVNRRPSKIVHMIYPGCFELKWSVAFIFKECFDSEPYPTLSNAYFGQFGCCDYYLNWHWSPIPWGTNIRGVRMEEKIRNNFRVAENFLETELKVHMKTHEHSKLDGYICIFSVEFHLWLFS